MSNPTQEDIDSGWFDDDDEPASPAPEPQPKPQPKPPAPEPEEPEELDIDQLQEVEPDEPPPAAVPPPQRVRDPVAIDGWRVRIQGLTQRVKIQGKIALPEAQPLLEEVEEFVELIDPTEPKIAQKREALVHAYLELNRLVEETRGDGVAQRAEALEQLYRDAETQAEEQENQQGGGGIVEPETGIAVGSDKIIQLNRLAKYIVTLVVVALAGLYFWNTRINKKEKPKIIFTQHDAHGLTTYNKLPPEKRGTIAARVEQVQITVTQEGLQANAVAKAVGHPVMAFKYWYIWFENGRQLPDAQPLLPKAVLTSGAKYQVEVTATARNDQVLTRPLRSAGLIYKEH